MSVQIVSALVFVSTNPNELIEKYVKGTCSSTEQSHIETIIDNSRAIQSDTAVYSSLTGLSGNSIFSLAETLNNLEKAKQKLKMTEQELDRKQEPIDKFTTELKKELSTLDELQKLASNEDYKEYHKFIHRAEDLQQEIDQLSKYDDDILGIAFLTYAQEFTSELDENKEKSQKLQSIKAILLHYHDVMVNQKQVQSTESEVQQHCDYIRSHGLDPSKKPESIDIDHQEQVSLRDACIELVNSKLQQVINLLTLKYPEKNFDDLSQLNKKLQSGNINTELLTEIDQKIRQYASTYAEISSEIQQVILINIQLAIDAQKKINHLAQYLELNKAPEEYWLVTQQIYKLYVQAYKILELPSPEEPSLAEIIPNLKNLKDHQQITNIIEIIEEQLSKIPELDKKQRLCVRYAQIHHDLPKTQIALDERASQLQQKTKLYLEGESSLDGLLDNLLNSVTGQENLSLYASVMDIRSKLGTDAFNLSSFEALDKAIRSQNKKIEVLEHQLDVLHFATQQGEEYLNKRVKELAEQISPEKSLEYTHPSIRFNKACSKVRKKDNEKHEYRYLLAWKKKKWKAAGSYKSIINWWNHKTLEKISFSTCVEEKFRKHKAILEREEQEERSRVKFEQLKKHDDAILAPDHLAYKILCQKKLCAEMSQQIELQQRGLQPSKEAFENACKTIESMSSQKHTIEVFGNSEKLAQLALSAEKDAIEDFKEQYKNFKITPSTTNPDNNTILHLLAQMDRDNEQYINHILENITLQSLHELLSIKNNAGKTPLQVCSESNKRLFLEKYFAVLKDALKTDINKAVNFFNEVSPLNPSQDFIAKLIDLINDEENIQDRTKELLQFINQTNALKLLNTSLCQKFEPIAQLFEALETLDVEKQRQFIKALVEQDFTAEKYQQPLINAINALINKNAQLAVQLNALLSTGDTLATLDAKGNTLLHLALDGKHDDLAKLLFEDTIPLKHFSQQNNDGVKPYQLFLENQELVTQFLNNYGYDAYVEQFDGLSLYKHTKEPVKSEVKTMLFDKCLTFIGNEEADKAQVLIEVNGLEFSELSSSAYSWLENLYFSYKYQPDKSEFNKKINCFFTFQYDDQSIYSELNGKKKKTFKKNILDLAIAYLSTNNTNECKTLLEINELSINDLIQRKKEQVNQVNQHALDNSIEELQKNNPGNLLTVAQANQLIRQCINIGGTKNEYSFTMENLRKNKAFRRFTNQNNEEINSFNLQTDSHPLIDKANEILTGKANYELLSAQEQARLYQLLNFAYDVEDEIANGQDVSIIRDYIDNIDSYLPSKPSSFLLYHEMMINGQTSLKPWDAHEIGTLLEQAVSVSSDREKKKYIKRCKELFEKGQKLYDDGYREDGHKLKDSVIRIALLAKHGETNKIPQLAQDKRYAAINRFRTSWLDIIRRFVNLFKKTTKSQKRLNALCDTPQKSNSCFFKPEKSCNMTYVGNTLPEDRNSYSNSYVLTDHELYFIDQDSNTHEIALNNHASFVNELLTMMNLTISRDSDTLEKYINKNITLPQSKLNQLLLNHCPVDKFHHDHAINKQDIILHRQVAVSA